MSKTLIAHKLFHKNDFVRIIKFFESFLGYCTKDLLLRTSKHFLSFFSIFNSFLCNMPFKYLKNVIWKTHPLNKNKTIIIIKKIEEALENTKHVYM